MWIWQSPEQISVTLTSFAFSAKGFFFLLLDVLFLSKMSTFHPVLSFQVHLNLISPALHPYWTRANGSKPDAQLLRELAFHPSVANKCRQSRYMYRKVSLISIFLRKRGLSRAKMCIWMHMHKREAVGVCMFQNLCKGKATVTVQITRNKLYCK